MVLKDLNYRLRLVLYILPIFLYNVGSAVVSVGIVAGLYMLTYSFFVVLFSSAFCFINLLLVSELLEMKLRMKLGIVDEDDKV